MKVYKVELMILDFDKLGDEGIRQAIENGNYPNDCISPRVKYIESREIGEWCDEHPLNTLKTQDVEYKRLFN